MYKIHIIVCLLMALAVTSLISIIRQQTDR